VHQLGGDLVRSLSQGFRVEDTILKFDTLKSARVALEALISALDGAGESLIAARLSTTLDAIDARLRRAAEQPASR
jgi:hypothetical protein